MIPWANKGVRGPARLSSRSTRRSGGTSSGRVIRIATRASGGTGAARGGFGVGATQPFQHGLFLDGQQTQQLLRGAGHEQAPGERRDGQASPCPHSIPRLAFFKTCDPLPPTNFRTGEVIREGHVRRLAPTACSLQGRETVLLRSPASLASIMKQTRRLCKSRHRRNRML